MKRILGTVAVLALAVGSVANTAFAGWDPEAEKKDLAAADQAIKDFETAEPGIDVYFKEAYAYAVFPSIRKRGFVIGGSRGSGLVFEGGKVVGSATVTEGSVGLQAGYQSYSELIFFKDKATLENFRNGDIKMSAQASAAARDQGAAAKAAYSDGVAVFMKSNKGLIVDASVGAQKFKYEPKRP